jgi:hypothetical protein
MLNKEQAMDPIFTAIDNHKRASEARILSP